MNDKERYRELPCWRKQFKRDWKKLVGTPIPLPLNPKYKPDSHRWVCTCPSFVRSRFLLCKHLVQAVRPVPPIFFLEVKRNRTTPFWQHPGLVLLEGSRPDTPAMVVTAEPMLDEVVEEDEGGEVQASSDEEGEDDDIVDTRTGE